NKKRYLAAKDSMERLSEELIHGIIRFDPLLSDVDPKKCLFRIYRDVRFSKDKSPYKTHFGLWFSPQGKKSGGPGYYLHIAPSSSFLAAGYWLPPSDHLKAI